MKKFIFIYLALSLVACGRQATDSLDAPTSFFDSWIPPNIQGQDRLAFQQAMSLVTPEQRNDFTLITLDGRILTNRPETKPNIQSTLLHAEQVRGNIFRYKENGAAFIAPKDTDLLNAGLQPLALPVCSSGSTTGAFYRSISKPGPGGTVGLLNYWTAAKATVTLPTSLTVAVNSGKQLETPYVLLGGWGSNDSGIAMDAGLQGNRKQDPTTGAVTWQWQIFFKSGTTTATSTSAVRFANGQDVDLSLLIYPSAGIGSSMVGILVASGGGQTVSVQNNASGWTSNGIRNVMKHGSFLAQNTTTLNGSGYGVTTWQNLFIGGYTGTRYPYGSNYVNWSGNGQYQCFNPDAARISLSDISIRDYLEEITISMR